MNRAGILTTFAGTGTYGYNGNGYLAINTALSAPKGVAVNIIDQKVYIADSGSAWICVVNTAGILTIFAGIPQFTGHDGDGGPATSALLAYPIAMAVDIRTGKVYIVDSGNYVVRVVNSAGIISTFAGTPGVGGYTSVNVMATSTKLYSPTGVAVDALNDGKILITDSGQSTVYAVNSAGYLTIYAGMGSEGHSGDGGPATNAQLDYPTGVAIDFLGNVYIGDVSSNSNVRMVTNGTRIITTFAGGGSYSSSLGDGGPATSAYLNFEGGVAVDMKGNVYIADTFDNRIRKVSNTLNYPTGQPSAWPSLPSNQPSSEPTQQPSAKPSNQPSAQPTFPSGQPSVQPSSEPSSVNIHQLTIVAGNPFTSGNSGDNGAATSATMYYPYDVTVDSSNNLYILDLYNNVVRKVDGTSGNITTVAGNGTTCTYGYSSTTSGSPVTSTFLMTARYQSSSSCGDNHIATGASFNNAYGIAVDVSGNLFVADRGNLVVRKMSAFTGLMSTVAGNGYYSSESVANGYNVCTHTCYDTCYDTCYSTCFNACCNSCCCGLFCWGTCTNDCGNCGAYSCDPFNCNPFTCNAYNCNPYSCGTCSYTTYSPGFEGDGSAATSAYLNNPSGVAVDISGNLYIADTGNNRIRMVTATTQIITTLVSTGITGATYMSNPWRIAVDQTGNVPSHQPVT